MKFANIQWKLALGLFVALALMAGNVWAQTGLDVEEAADTEPAADEQIQEVKDAAALFGKGDVAGAVALLKKAGETNPDMRPAQVIVAGWFARLRQGAAVRTSLERAIIEEPTDPEAFVILADVDLQQRQVTEAALLYEKAANLLGSFTKSQKRKDNLQSRVYLGQARVAQARGDLDTAKKKLEDLLAITPEKGKPAVMNTLAEVLFKQGEVGPAKEMLNAAWTARNEAGEDAVHYGALMANLYAKNDQPDAAKQWMDFAVKSEPENTQLRIAAATMALRRADLTDAMAQANEALKVDPQSIGGMILRGAVALFQKNYAAAEADFQKAHLAQPGNFAASNNLALALCEQDDDTKKQQALQYARNNVQANDKSAEAASTLGWVLYKMGDLKNAELALRQAATLSRSSGRPLSQDTRYYIAQVYADAAKLAETQSQDEAAVKFRDQAKQILQSALSGKQPFSQKPEAEKLAKELGL